MGNDSSSTGETPAAAISAVPRTLWLLLPAVIFSLITFGTITYYLQHVRKHEEAPPRDWVYQEARVHAESDPKPPGSHDHATPDQPHLPHNIASAEAVPLAAAALNHRQAAQETAMKAATPSESHQEAPVIATPVEQLVEASPPALDDKLAQADELLREGNYRLARDEYALLIVKSHGLHEAHLRMRLALCEETLGNFRQAQLEFRRILELNPRPALREAAVLGQARVWHNSGRGELATATLLQSLLEGACRKSNIARSEIPHQLALLMAEAIQPIDIAAEVKLDDVCADQILLSPHLSVQPQTILAALNDPEPAASPLPEFQPGEDIVIVQRFSNAPEEIFIHVRTERLTALELVRRVANKCGWEVRLTDEARLRLQERTLQPDAIDLPLALVLDALLAPFELVWETRQDAILVCPANRTSAVQMNRYRLQTANRTLRFACTFAPEHPWAVASYLELGRVAAYRGELETGARNIEKAIEQYPRSEYLPIGWFNLGKLELRQGRWETALLAFYRAADLLAGQSLEPASYLYAGRLQLEHETPRSAISPLTRALVLAEGTPAESAAALQLASAYLMLQHYQRANEILMDHRSAFKTQTGRDQAAFLASLVRYRAAADDADRFREGATLIGTLTNLKVEQCFGGHWWYLAGLAYRDVGMRNQEIDLFTKCLAGPYEFALQEQMRLLLLEDAPGQISARGTLSETGNAPTDAFHAKAMVIEATGLFRRGADADALAMCRELLQRPHVADSMRREALRLMGHIYQTRGEYNLAVECFTGLIPAPTSRDSESSARQLPLGELR